MRSEIHVKSQSKEESRVTPEEKTKSVLGTLPKSKKNTRIDSKSKVIKSSDLKIQKGLY